jgi:hypothetical protein
LGPSNGSIEGIDGVDEITNDGELESDGPSMMNDSCADVH